MHAWQKLTRATEEDGDGSPLITPYRDVNAIVRDLLAGIAAVLGDQVVGIYLDGSLANGDFDSISDIDFIAVTRDEVSPEQFVALQRMHDDLSKSDSPWALELEGSYISQRALWRHDPANAFHPNLERGAGERLKMVHHNAGWVVHRYIMRERGIVVSGPPPHTLIDVISPDDLRDAARSVVPEWAAGLLEHDHWVDADGYHSYIVLTLCRILYTIETGAVASKRASVAWAQKTLANDWQALIEKAWFVRQSWFERQPDTKSLLAEHADDTRAFIRYVLDKATSE